MPPIKRVAASVNTGFQQSDTITQGPFAVTFNQPVTAMLTEDGLHLVIAPPGTTITGYTPAPTTVWHDRKDDTPVEREVGGSMLNPQVRTASAHRQGFDQRAANFDITLRPTFPQPVANGDVFVVSTPAPPLSWTYGQRNRAGSVETYGAFFFVQSFPAGTGVFAPACCGWTGRSVLTPYNVDLDAYLDTLPSLSLANVSAPPVQTVVDTVNRFYGGGYMTYGTSGGYEDMLPRGAAFGTNMNYGRSVGVVLGAAGLHLIGDAATREQKRTILKRFVQMAINWFDPRAAGAPGPLNDGGHHQFQAMPIAVGLHAMGRTAELDSLHTTFSGLHQFGQTFYWTAAQVAQIPPHTNTSHVYFSRRRTVRQISTLNPRRFTVTTGTGDPAQRNWTNLRIFRWPTSDWRLASFSSIVSNDTTSSRYWTNLGFTSSEENQHYIETESVIPGLAPGDEIYAQPYPGHDIQAGDVDWRITPNDTAINPTRNANYRNLQGWADDLLVMRAIPGLWRSDWQGLRDLVTFAQSGTWPVPGNAYHDHHETVSFGWGQQFAFSRTFWAAHAATLGLT